MTPSMQTTERLGADEAGLCRAAALLRESRLVAFPTETVYGLGARADREDAAAAIYAAKGRPAHNPLIVHVPDIAAAEALADLPAPARALADRFWPGPLTLVLPRREGALAAAVSAGLPSVAIRVPAHPLARRLLELAQVPVAAPSANPSGRVSPTTAEHVAEGLSGRIAAILDGGPCPVGLESAIVGFRDGRPVLLRPGGLPAEAIEEIAGPLLPPGPNVAAPGMLASHYAPGARLRLNADAPREGEGWLGFGPGPAWPAGLNLSPSGDLAEAAARLFAALRAVDALLAHRGTIAVAPIPQTGLGAAINDRLRRAAAPRQA